MKNYGKTSDYSVSLREASADSQVSECINLRIDMADGRSVMAPCPGLRSITQGELLPLAAYHAPDGTQYILFRYADPRTGFAILCGEALTDVEKGRKGICAMAYRSGFVVMTETGPIRFTLNEQGDWDCHLVANFIPKLILKPVGIGVLTASTSPLSLTSTDFSRTDPSLSEAGLKKLSGELSAAYRRLSALAVDAGAWIQPVAARYRLIGDAGEVIYTSLPVAMTCGGWQARKEISVTCAKSGDSTLEVPQITLSARAFRPQFEVTDSLLAKMTLQGVRKIELWLSPQIHPFDPAQTAATRITRGSTASPALTVAIPGATDNFSSRNNARLSQLHRLEDLQEKGSTCVAVIDLTRLADRHQCVRADSMTPEAENDRVARILDATPLGAASDEPADSLVAEISSPNSFVARTVAVSGDTVVWGDITPLPAASVNISELTADFSGIPFEGVILSERADASRSVIPISGPSMPRAWAPAVSYPDPSVCRLEIFLRPANGGSALHGQLEMKASADGIRALWDAPEMEPVAFESWQGQVPLPEDPPPAARHPGTLVACSMTSPLLPVASVECCHSPVHALHPALRSRSSWDFSRCRLYAFSDAAIHAVSVSPAKGTMSAAVIDTRGIAGPRAAVYTPLGVMALHQGNLLKITSPRADTIAFRVPACNLAWDEERGCLWLMNENGDMRIFYPETGRWADIPSPADFVTLSTVGNRLWLTDRDELYRPESEAERSVATDRRVIGWQSDIPLPQGAVVEAVGIKLSATFADLTFTLLAQGAPVSRHPLQLLKMRVTGVVTAPIFRRVIPRPAPFLTLRISGSCSPDLRLHSINLKIRKPC